MIHSLSGVGTGTFCIQLLKGCKLLTANSLYVFEVLNFLKMFKYTIQKNKQIHEHNTGTNTDLHIKLCNTNLYKKKLT